MAQYYTDFSEYTLGEVPAEWPVEWGVISRSIVSGNPTPDSDKSMSVVGEGNYLRTATSWGAAGTSSVASASARLTGRFGSGGGRDGICSPILCGGGEQSTRTGYFLFVRTGNDILLRRAISGSVVTLASVPSVIPTLSIEDQDISIELSVSEDGLITAHVWVTSDGRPAEPLIEYTDSAPLGAGWNGFLDLSSEDHAGFRLHYFGVGTNGDPAPTEPVGGEPENTSDAQADTATHTATATRGAAGTAAHAADRATGAATGARGSSGTATHQADTATGTGGQPVLAGTADHQATTATQQALGTRIVAGSATHNAERAVHNALAQRGTNATANHAADHNTQTATGTRVVTATAQHQAQPVTHTAEGQRLSGQPNTAQHQAQRATHAATGQRVVTGTATHAANDATHAATGQRVQEQDGFSNAQADRATHTGVILRVITGSATHTAQPAQHTAQGRRQITGAAAHQADRATHSGLILRRADSTASHQADPAQHTAVGVRRVNGSSDAQAQTATSVANDLVPLDMPILDTRSVVVQDRYGVVVQQDVTRADVA